jgi:drug/metabolite transporter (DMT)-like permease
MTSPIHSLRHPFRTSARGERDLVIGVAYAAFGAIAFSGKAIIVKLGYRYGADAITLIALRMLIALPFFVVISLAVQRRGRHAAIASSDRWKIVALGFLGYYLASYLDFLGLAYVSATLERLILYLNPTLVLLIGVAFFKRRVAARQLVALALGYAGVVLAFAHDVHAGGDGIVLGSALVFASALSYAIYLVGSGELVNRVGSIRLTAYASCIAALCCLVHFAVTRPLVLLFSQPAPVYGLSLINGTLCTVVPLFAVMMGISRIGAMAASQIGMIGPVSTIVLAALLLDEHMGAAQIVGTILVLVGVFIVSQSRTTMSAVPTPSTQ